MTGDIFSLIHTPQGPEEAILAKGVKQSKTSTPIPPALTISSRTDGPGLLAGLREMRPGQDFLQDEFSGCFSSVSCWELLGTELHRAVNTALLPVHSLLPGLGAQT